MPFSMTSTVSRIPSAMVAPVGEDLIILGLASNSYIALDAVGQRIWALVAEPVRVAELCRRLGEEFNGSADQITLDVLAFLQELETEGLVHDARPASV